MTLVAFTLQHLRIPSTTISQFERSFLLLFCFHFCIGLESMITAKNQVNAHIFLHNSEAEKERRHTGNSMSLWNLKACSWWHDLSNKPHLLVLPKQFNQLETNYWSIWFPRGHFHANHHTRVLWRLLIGLDSLFLPWPLGTQIFQVYLDHITYSRVEKLNHCHFIPRSVSRFIIESQIFAMIKYKVFALLVAWCFLGQRIESNFLTLFM